MKKSNHKFWIVKFVVLTVAFGIAFTGYFGVLPIYEKVSGNVSGPPESHTNAPGEGNCTACHSDFPVNGGPGSVTITDVPAEYTPGAQVQITVTVAQTNTIAFGFQITAVDSLGNGAGNFSLIGGNNEMQIITGMVGMQTRQYVEHRVFGTSGSATRSWTFNWTAPGQPVGPITFYAAGNAADGDSSSAGDVIYIANKVTNPPAAAATQFDFDGDAKTDVSIFRPGPGEWWYLRSSDNGNRAFQFGQGSDVMVPADFTGDGIADFAFWRPSTGEWFVLRSDNTGFYSFPFGANGDIPAPGDFDGDGIDDYAVFRPSVATWFILRSSDGNTDFIGFGANGDKPMVGDYDNDGKDDVGIYRPTQAQFWLRRSTAGLAVYQFGAVGDYAFAADFSGDGSDDIGVWRPSTGFWFILRSEDVGFYGFQFGATGDIPAPGDYDGDGIADPTVFRPSSPTWFSVLSSSGSVSFTTFGAAGDRPVPTSYAYQPAP